MAKGRQRKKRTGSPTVLAMTGMLTTALKESQDFIVTFEPKAGDDKKRDIHILTGNLITSCMLGNLMRRARLFEDEGAMVVTWEWE